MRLDHDRCSSCFLTAETAQPLCQQQTDLSLSTCLPLSYSNLPLHRFWFGSVGSDEKFSSVASTPPPPHPNPPKHSSKIFMSKTANRWVHFRHCLQGHAEMRADRELKHDTAVGIKDVEIFKNALNHLHGQEMEPCSTKVVFLLVCVKHKISAFHNKSRFLIAVSWYSNYFRMQV